MAKILNLDELQSSVDKTVVLKGVKHEFKPLEVGEFIDQLKEVEAMEAAGSMKASEYVEYMIRIIKRGFPTIDAAELRKLSTDKLKALSDFVKDESSEDAKAGADAASGE